MVWVYPRLWVWRHGRLWGSLDVTKARGKEEKLDLLQVAGIDTRIWQKDGTSTDNKGIVYTLKGEVAKVDGIQPLVDWAYRRGAKKSSDPVDQSPFYNPVSGRLYPIMSVGAFNLLGAVEILVEFGGNIAVVRGNTLEIIASGRRVAERPSEGTQFIQIGDCVLILNGVDPNLKWDGYKATPLGISSAPSSPILPGFSDGYLPNQVVLSAYSEYFYPGVGIEKVAEDTTNSFTYRMTWLNDQGAESEASDASVTVTDKNILPDVPTSGGAQTAAEYVSFFVKVAGLGQAPPQSDIIARRLYRAGKGGQVYYLLADLPGTHSDTYLDTTVVAFTQDNAPLRLSNAGTNLPPPLSKFSIFFREVAFYAGNPASPRSLYYSKPGGEKEAVPQPTNIIQITTEDGSDYITAMAVAADYGLVFTKRSIHMLTMSRDGVTPRLNPVSQTIGACGNRAVATFEGQTYFFSSQGVFVFDGAAPRPLSRELNDMVKSLPRAYLKDAVAFVDPDERRVLFSVVAGPTSKNNEVWAVHVDTGAISKIGAPVYDAVRYKDETLVAFSYPHTGFLTKETSGPDGEKTVVLKRSTFDVTDLGVWGCKNSLAEKAAIDGFFETKWFIGNNPEDDKTFHRIDLFYVQTGDYPLDIEWSTDWSRESVNSTSVTMKDPNGLAWNETVLSSDGLTSLKRTWNDQYPAGFTPNSLKDWDEERIRSVRIDLFSSSTTDVPDSELTAKSIKFKFSSTSSSSAEVDEMWRRWKIVGFVLFYSDHGMRAEGTDVPSA